MAAKKGSKKVGRVRRTIRRFRRRTTRGGGPENSILATELTGLAAAIPFAMNVSGGSSAIGQVIYDLQNNKAMDAPGDFMYNAIQSLKENWASMAGLIGGGVAIGYVHRHYGTGRATRVTKKWSFL